MQKRTGGHYDGRSTELREYHETEEDYVRPDRRGYWFGVAIGAAPLATAANQQSCAELGSSTQCQTPGNVQIQNFPPGQPSGARGFGRFFPYDRGDREGPWRAMVVRVRLRYLASLPGTPARKAARLSLPVPLSTDRVKTAARGSASNVDVGIRMDEGVST